LVVGGIRAVVASTRGPSSASPSEASPGPSVAPPGAPSNLHAAVTAFQMKHTVTAVGADEQRTAASVWVATKTAPPGTAAPTGTFNVHLHNTSHSGFSSFGNANVNDGWRFLPQCNEPPCNTQSRNMNTKKMVVLLKQKGGSYSGSASVPGLVTKFSGTMSQYASAQLGCTSSSASFTVTGTSLKG
jgi:hypothetical protein